MENDYVTPPPNGEKTPEQIEREMLQTREALTEKVAALETQVVGTVQSAADTLTGTVEAVKELVTAAPSAVTDTVKQAASAVSETMKKTLDISGHVREHPWASVGVSAGLGFLTGLLVFRERTGTAASPPPSSPAYRPAAGSPPGEPGVFDQLIGMIGRKVREVAENLIDSATAAVNQNVREGVPKLVDAAADRLTPSIRANETGRFAGYHG